MSLINEMSLKQILEEFGMNLSGEDIGHFCIKIQTRLELENIFRDSSITDKKVEKFLIDHESDIDKEKFVMILWKNNMQSQDTPAEEILQLRQKNEILQASLSRTAEPQLVLEITKKMQQNRDRIQELKDFLQKKKAKVKGLKNLLKGVDNYLTSCEYDSENKQYQLVVLHRSEMINGRKRNNEAQRKNRQDRFDSIDAYLKKEGMSGFEELIMSSFLVTGDIDLFDELKVAFPDEIFGNDFIYMLIQNIRQIQEESGKSIEDQSITDYLPYIKKSLREYVEYIDLNKLLLAFGYRFHEALEAGLSKEMIDDFNIKNALKCILNSINNSNASFYGELEGMENNIRIPVSYSVAKLRQCLRQITENGYITDKQVQQYRRQVREKTITLSKMTKGTIRACFLTTELEDIAVLSEDNLKYVVENNDLDAKKTTKLIRKRGKCSNNLLSYFLHTERLTPEDVIELYVGRYIELDAIRQIRSEYDLSKEVEVQKMYDLYKAWQLDPENKKKQEEYQRCVDLYKVINIEEQDEEKQEEHSTEIMGCIIDNFENDIDSENAILNFYREGIIIIHTIADLYEQDHLIALCDQGVIHKEDVQQLMQEGYLPANYLSDKYMQKILSGEIEEREEIVELLCKGTIQKENIDELLSNGFIGPKDLEKLVEANIITSFEKETIESNFDFMRALNSTGHGHGIKPMEKFHITRSDTNPSGPKEKKPRIIIDPEKRQEFFAALGLSHYVFDEEMSPDNPFYHYHFYVKIDEKGNPVPDSPVIAERFYEDKNTKARFATENATYIFRAKDYLVLNRYAGKSETIQERKGEIYRSNHVLANEKGKGHWATSVINNFMRIVMQSDLSELKKDQQALEIIERMKETYSLPDLMRIYKYEWEIDKGEHLLIEEEKKEKNPTDVSDDTEEPTL